MLRKLVSLVLALCLCMSAVSALASVTPAGEYPIVDEPTTLTVWAPLCVVDDYNTVKMTEWFEEQTGVHIIWQSCSSAEWQTLFNTAVAGNDWPDIFMPYTLSGAEYLQFAEDGVLIPLNDLIEEYGYYIKDFFAEYPEVKEAVTAPDGNIYGFPTMAYTYSEACMNKVWVYKEWLERYMTETGNPSPTTVDEFKTMLAFFRDNDMNGNGDTTDEIPLTGNYNRSEQGSDPCYYVLNAYCYLPTYPESASFLYIEDGVVKTDVMSDGFREGLKVLNEMYNEGLLSSEIFVQDLNTMRSITSTTKDKVVAACVAAPFTGRLLNSQSGENDVKYYDYVALEPLKDADGNQQSPTTSANTLNIRCFITSTCEHPEIAMRWMDFFYNIKTQQYVLYGGVEGEDWNYVEAESLAGDPIAVRSNWNAEELGKNVLNGAWVGVRMQTKDLHLAVEKATASTTQNWEAFDAYYPHARFSNIPTIVWCTDSDVSAEFSEQENLFKSYVKTGISEFVLGIKDINNDADWNAYLEKLNSMHVTEFLDLAAEYYSLK